jgi:GntR family transcriptional regulator/MocR family aminotransferase
MDVGTGIARARDARLAHVTPSNQFPMGALLSMERRRALVRWAREAGSWIIEDDYDCEFRFHGPPYPAIRSLDGADVCTIYVNTFSKILFPALALGFVVLPDQLVEPFSLARAQRVYPPAIPPQLTLARFLEEGHFLRHIRRMRQVYLKRGETLEADLAEALPGQVRVSRPGAGAHLIAWLRPGENDRAVAERAASAGVIAPPLSRFRQVASKRGALVLGYGGSPVTQIHDAVGKLRRAFR